MYDMTKLVSRTWEITFLDGEKLHILPWKIKDKIQCNVYAKENTLEALINCAMIIINNNKEQKAYSKEQIEKLFDEDLLADFVEKYTNWVSEISDEKN